jgi:SAM-dependent methyltransferase
MLSFLTRRPGSDLALQHPPPEQPWTEEYAAAHVAFLEHVFADPSLIRAVQRGRLPDGWGIGLDERVVEYPWLLAQSPRGRVLDAGSTLNHAHVLDRVLPLVDELHVVTLAPEERSFPERGISYVYADLRGLPYRDGSFETVVSLSTLEHVGKDNSRYGGSASEDEPDAALGRALAELRRVLAPGGTMLVSVPYGRREDHGWFRQLNEEDVARLVSLAAPARFDLAVFAYDVSGWHGSSARDAGDASYRDFTADQSPVPDLAAAARAVACLRMQF